MNSWALLGLGVAMMVIVFLISWEWARRVDNYSLVDAVWAFGIGLTAVTWLGFSSGYPKQWVAGVMVGLWSLRLGWHLQRRIRKHHPQEDARYIKLREVWNGRVASAFLWFFQAQALSVVLLALPFFAIARDPDGIWSSWESAGVVLYILGIAGEALADGQMSAFKSRNHDSSAVCQEGLWYYSRHPNYFFEGVIWIGFHVFACGSDWGWATVHAPVMIIYLLLRVTGIPPTEAAAVLRKGDAYRRYQKTTSPFIPWPPRRES
jgi:steroid 5-alpha reductase family enzyme